MKSIFRERAYRINQRIVDPSLLTFHFCSFSSPPSLTGCGNVSTAGTTAWPRRIRRAVSGLCRPELLSRITQIVHFVFTL